MGNKTNITISVDSNLVEMARLRKLNMSQACSDGLRVALQIPNDIQELENEVKSLKGELELKKDRLDIMKQEREERLMARATEENRMETAINNLMENYVLDRKPVRGKDGLETIETYQIGMDKIREIANDEDVSYEKLVKWAKEDIAEYNDKTSTVVKAKLTNFHPRGVRETKTKAGVNPT